MSLPSPANVWGQAWGRWEWGLLGVVTLAHGKGARGAGDPGPGIGDTMSGMLLLSLMAL